MATTVYKTPGVYIREPDSFPPSIVGVATAVPAFVGYTEKASDGNGRSLANVPFRISSLAEYFAHFGGAFQAGHFLSRQAPGSKDRDVGQIALGQESYHLVQQGLSRFNLFDSVRLFYANGGGDCFILACSPYEQSGTAAAVNADVILAGLNIVEQVVGPTILAVPDAVLLDDAGYARVVRAMLDQCGRRGDRVAIFDIKGAEGSEWDRTPGSDPVEAFRAAVGDSSDSRRYGIAYFPFLRTSLVKPEEVPLSSLDPKEDALLGEALAKACDGKPEALVAVEDWLSALASGDKALGTTGPSKLRTSLMAVVPGFADLLRLIAESRNVLPPSGAMAGVYATNDATRGVWNAPANVAIVELISPTIAIGDSDQEDLNVPLGGLAVNAIRSFPGRGTLVWGARTLDSNSNDWRYVQVRRTMIYIEQSIATALNAFVFAPNTAVTWVTVVSMIESFLHGLWAAGGLMGASPVEAYNVQAGLGSTMTPDDVLKGVMVVQVTLQMVHPAEFIQLTFTQEMLGGS